MNELSIIIPFMALPIIVVVVFIVILLLMRLQPPVPLPLTICDYAFHGGIPINGHIPDNYSYGVLGLHGAKERDHS